MDNAAVFIEAVGDNVEVLGVAAVVAAEDRIGHMVSELNEARCTAINKKWRVGYVLKIAPTSSGLAEFAAEFLERCLTGGFVENDHPAMRFTFTPQPGEKVIKALAEILERH